MDFRKNKEDWPGGTENWLNMCWTIGSMPKMKLSLHGRVCTIGRRKQENLLRYSRQSWGLSGGLCAKSKIDQTRTKNSDDIWWYMMYNEYLLREREWLLCSVANRKVGNLNGLLSACLRHHLSFAPSIILSIILIQSVPISMYIYIYRF